MSLTMGALIWLLGALAGSMLFFGIVVAPQVFRSLPADQAGSFLRAFFPRYYLWGFILAGIGTLLALQWGWPTALICAAVAVMFLFARQYLMPLINAARDAELEGDTSAGRRFQRLHLASVVLNSAQFVMLLGVAAILTRA